MKQTERVLRHMSEHGSITQLEAMQEYGIYRLASRIADLRRVGYKIEVETVCGHNRYGEKTHYAKYSLGD